MFSIFKKSPRLIELIPKGSVDIHSHILPGIDDGAKNVFQASKLIKEMHNIGFDEIIATPHTMSGVWNNTSDDIKKSYDVLIDNNPIYRDVVRYSSEYLLDSTFLDKIQSEKLLCLKENYILVELSYLQQPINLYEIIYTIQDRGYVPILAHPERYAYYANDFKRYYRLKDLGCLFQLNLLSSIGYYGKSVAKTTQKLLLSNLIDFVGSDIHHQQHISCFYNKLVIKGVGEIELAINSNKLFSV